MLASDGGHFFCLFHYVNFNLKYVIESLNIKLRLYNINYFVIIYCCFNSLVLSPKVLFLNFSFTLFQQDLISLRLIRRGSPRMKRKV